MADERVCGRVGGWDGRDWGRERGRVEHRGGIESDGRHPEWRVSAGTASVAPQRAWVGGKHYFEGAALGKRQSRARKRARLLFEP